MKSVTVQQKTHLSLTCCTTSVWRRLRSSHLKISFSKYTRPSSLFLFFISVAIILFYQITTVSVFIDPFTVHWLTVTGFGTGTTIILIQILTNLISIICWSWEESTSGYYSQILCTNIRRPLLITVSITRRYWIHSVIFHSSFYYTNEMYWFVRAQLVGSDRITPTTPPNTLARRQPNKPLRKGRGLYLFPLRSSLSRSKSENVMDWESYGAEWYFDYLSTSSPHWYLSISSSHWFRYHNGIQYNIVHQHLTLLLLSIVLENTNVAQNKISP